MNTAMITLPSILQYIVNMSFRIGIVLKVASILSEIIHIVFEINNFQNRSSEFPKICNLLRLLPFTSTFLVVTTLNNHNQERVSDHEN